jgi:chaperonin cofactor prefoldin
LNCIGGSNLHVILRRDLAKHSMTSAKAANRAPDEHTGNAPTRAILPSGRTCMSQEQDDAAARLKQEHEAAKNRLESLREEARRLGHEFEEKLKPEILEAEVELTRLSGMLGQIGL